MSSRYEGRSSGGVQRLFSATGALVFAFFVSPHLGAQEREAGAEGAEETEPSKENRDTNTDASGAGLAPGIPQVSALPGGFQPAYAPGAGDLDEWHADFHGYLTMPLKLGINRRSGTVTDDQFETVVHAPAEVPEYRDSFRYTAALPEPYVQLNFGYGNSRVEANVILQARSAATATSFFDASTRGGITDAFLTFKLPDLSERVGMKIHVGAFTNRYGIMGQYDEGLYGTPLFARTNGVGENIVASLDTGDVDFELQQGFQSQFSDVPLGITPGDWNDYADPNLGTSLVHHFHASATYEDLVTLGGHYMMAWTMDDITNHGDLPDGRINLVGGDMRLTLKRYGHLYFNTTFVDANHSRSVGRIVEVLNSVGGPGLIRNYFGPQSNGTGELLIFGGQYNLSIARALYGDYFQGQSPDIMVNLFSIGTVVSSTDPEFDGVTKLKYGGEISYAVLPWLAASFRGDYVAPDLSDSDEAYFAVSPRLIFRSDWQSRDQVMLQYSNYSYGNEVFVRSGSPARLDRSIDPDEHVVSLSASMWW